MDTRESKKLLIQYLNVINSFNYSVNTTKTKKKALMIVVISLGQLLLKLKSLAVAATAAVEIFRILHKKRNITFLSVWLVGCLDFMAYQPL